MPVATPKFPIERLTLANGLRVALSPDRSSPAVAVAVYYDVGFRSEPQGRTGFAHLFEHLMFQGSAHLEKLEHFRLVQGNGGVFNGSTSNDWTNYFEVMPSNALELALFLEADRMLSPRLTQDNLENQISVVKEEVRVNVLNQPYGGFPWLDLPAVLFKTFPNAHNAYGEFRDLDAASLDDASAFFKRYYCPANAVLSVAGDFDVASAARLIDLHFGPIPKRRAPAKTKTAEPPPTRERRRVRYDPKAPEPATAIGFRVPDPLSGIEAYGAAVLLASVLGGGEASRLHQRLVKQDKIASHVGSHVGLASSAFEVRDPSMLQVIAMHPGPHRQVVDTVVDEIARVAGDLGFDEIDRHRAVLASEYLRSVDGLMRRAQLMAVFELQRGQAEFINELTAALDRVSPEQVREVAESCLGGRAVVEIRPGTKPVAGTGSKPRKAGNR